MNVNGIGHPVQNVRGARVNGNQANGFQQRVVQEHQIIKDEFLNFAREKRGKKDVLVGRFLDADAKVKARIEVCKLAGLNKAQILEDAELKRLVNNRNSIKNAIQVIDKSIDIKKKFTKQKMQVENMKAALTNQVMSALNGGQVEFHSRSTLGKALKGQEVVDVKFDENFEEIKQKKGLKTETGYPAEIVCSDGTVLKALVHQNADGTFEIHGMKKK